MTDSRSGFRKSAAQVDLIGLGRRVEGRIFEAEVLFVSDHVLGSAKLELLSSRSPLGAGIACEIDRVGRLVVLAFVVNLEAQFGLVRVVTVWPAKADSTS